MHMILRPILLFLGAFFVYMGINFLIDPVVAGGGFGLDAKGALGLASLRADFTAFFVVSGGLMAWGAWTRNGDPLLVSAALMGVALFGRLVSLALDGPYDGFWIPMAVEAITVVLALVGSKLLPHSALEPDG